LLMSAPNPSMGPSKMLTGSTSPAARCGIHAEMPCRQQERQCRGLLVFSVRILLGIYSIWIFCCYFSETKTDMRQHSARPVPKASSSGGQQPDGLKAGYIIFQKTIHSPVNGISDTKNIYA
jgi:hypothetical protein